MTPRRRRLLLALAAALAVLALAWAARAALLAGVARLLDVSGPPRPAELIYVMGGDVASRPFVAAELYRRGMAPRVVIPREQRNAAVRMGLLPENAEVTRAVLLRRGVPAAAVVVLDVPGGSTSTASDARALAAYLRAHPARRVLVVTHRWHTRRARWLLRRELAGTGVEVAMVGAPDDGFGQDDWWRSEAGLVTYANEYLKWAHNLVYR